MERQDRILGGALAALLCAAALPVLAGGIGQIDGRIARKAGVAGYSTSGTSPRVARITDALNVGTTTDAGAVGGFSAGLAGASRIHYDASGGIFNLYNTTGQKTAQLGNSSTPLIMLLDGGTNSLAMTVVSGAPLVYGQSDLQFAWASSAGDLSGALDLGLARSAAGVLRVTDGSTGSGFLTIPGTGTNSQRIGPSTSSNGNQSLAVGDTTLANGHQATAIGAGNNALAQGSTVVGQAGTISSGHTGAIILGSSTASSAANQLLLGGVYNQIDDVYIGSGPTAQFIPASVKVQPSGPSAAAGSDQNGIPFTIAGGKGSGAGTPGNLVFQTSDAGSSGTTLQTLATRLTISPTAATFTGEAVAPTVRLGSGGPTLTNVSGTVVIAGNIQPSGAAATYYRKGWSLTTRSTAVSIGLNTTYDKDTVHTNEGATAQVVYTLPSAAAGYTYMIVVQDTDGIRVDAASGDTIRVAGTVTAADGYVESTTIGDTLTIVAINATEWVAIASHGTWTAGP